jgi:O-antigen ligase
VYTWAWLPVLVCGAALGGASVVVAARRGTLQTKLAVALVALGLAASVQLVPLSRPALATASPGASRFLSQFDLTYALAPAATPPDAPAARHPRHPLSIDPRATGVGVVFLVSFGLLLLGLSSTLTACQARAVVDGVLVLGFFLGLIGIAQETTADGRIYGFWRPFSVADPFGPFVNKNHFAGWMAMAIPLGMGRLCERIARFQHEATARPNRLLWLDSPPASRIVLGGVALFVMTLSLFLTLSRSGIAALVVALLLFSVGLARRSTRAPWIAAGIAGLFVVVILWSGADPIARRFTASTWPDLLERMRAWGDAVSIVRDFPLTGTGLNTYTTATVLYASPELTHHYSAAHSDYLQLAAEGGLLLGVPSLALVIVCVRTIARRLRDARQTFWLRSGATASLLAIALQEGFDFSLQIPANTALLVVVAAIALSHGSRQS